MTICQRMHSKNINESTKVKDPWIIAHHSWDPRLLPKHPFYCCTIHLIMFLKNDSSGRNNIASAMGVVHACKCFSLTQVTNHTQVVDAAQQNQAARTWTSSKISDTSDQDSGCIQFNKKLPLKLGYSLFFVIGRICEYPGIKSAFDSIPAHNHYAVPPSLQEIII